MKVTHFTAVCLLIWQCHGKALSDPQEEHLPDPVLQPNSTFEPFYPARAYGQASGAARAAHGHGSFYSARSPALVDVKNAPAYGFRFDGYRRFNFD